MNISENEYADLIREKPYTFISSPKTKALCKVAVECSDALIPYLPKKYLTVELMIRATKFCPLLFVILSERHELPERIWRYAASLYYMHDSPLEPPQDEQFIDNQRSLRTLIAGRGRNMIFIRQFIFPKWVLCQYPSIAVVILHYNREKIYVWHIHILYEIAFLFVRYCPTLSNRIVNTERKVLERLILSKFE